MMLRAIVLSTLALGLAGLLALIARRASAATRHAIWLVGLTTSLGIAIFSAFGPVIEVEAPVVNGPGVISFPAEFIEALPVAPAAISAPLAPTDFAAPPSGFRGPDPVLTLWLLGVIFVIGRAVLGHAGIARLIRRSRPMPRGSAIADADVRISADVEGPYTLGTRNPVILLPADADTWTDERLRIVLVHELAHVARFDYAAQLVATAACAVYWFNPVTWIAASRLRAEAEHAADDRVLAAGVDGITYASHLLELARPDTGRLSTAVAVGMARGTNRLERRFTAMFDSQRSRGVVPLRFQAIAGSAALMAAVPLTALRLVPATAPAVPAPVAAAAPAPEPVVHSAAPLIRPVSPSTQQTANLANRPSTDTIVEGTLAASAGESISITLRSGGSIRVRSWDQPQVRMRGVLSGTDSRETRVIFERVGRGIELRTVVDAQRRNSSNSNAFEVWVPRKFDIAISSGGGEIDISGVEGRFTGSTGGGEINLVDVKGVAELSTGGGEVNVVNSTLDGRVVTGGGEAIVTGTSGNVRVSSGSGPVVRTDGQTRVYGVGGIATSISSGSRGSTSTRIAGTGANLSMSWAGGDIRFDELPDGGTFITGGGDIDVGGVGGRATFTTGGGDARILNVRSDIAVTTGGGSVEIGLADGNTASNISVTSGSGRIVIEVPRNLDVQFDLETAYTERHGRTNITSDIPLTVTETQDWDSRNGTPRRYVRASGSAGNGRGVIKVRTVNGDVIIRRR